VTAYKGAARLITNKDYLEAAAGILGVEAYHASEVRTLLYGQQDVVAAAGLKVKEIVQAISNLRDTLAGSEKDQGITSSTADTSNIVPVDASGIAFSRSTREVLNIVYGAANATKGLFFPNGMNGEIK
jgi:Ferritin-like domain